MTRRIIAAGGGVLLLILLILAVRGCLDARKEQAFKDYVQDVASIVQESDQQGRAFFGLLSGPGGREEAVDIENRLNGFRVQSAALVDRARDTDHPDELDGAQRSLVETLEFRRDGLAQVADALPTALGDQERRQGTDRVAAQMQNFLASDVIYSQRFVTSLNEQLDKENLQEDVRIPRSQFLPDIDWLEPGFVADRVSGIRTGGGDEAAEPGLHGTGLGSVTLGGQALSPGGTATVKLADDLQFQVQLANQGEHTETDVAVRITVGRGGEAIELEEQLDTIAAGETKTVDVPLAEKPPTDEPQQVAVEIEPVPGEKKTDNNKQSYSVIFTE
jgi:hypothetical protein